ncbi:kappa-type opioid receptor-like [Drosophila serrata]|uniref:kappa-type opioid receptor-like n=1 Tax=Drosophila serrata TaxID=7274 RepID=UPI000A1D27F7|nr:kappa-type opioid receptor-like [Drosophila serrata]
MSLCDCPVIVIIPMIKIVLIHSSGGLKPHSKSVARQPLQTTDDNRKASLIDLFNATGSGSGSGDRSVSKSRTTRTARTLLRGSLGVAVARLGHLPRLTSIGVGPRIRLLLLLLLLSSLLLHAQDALPAAAGTSAATAAASTASSSQQAGLSRGAASGGDGPHHPAHRIPADEPDRHTNAYSNSTAAAEAVTETTAETSAETPNTTKDGADADAEQMLPQIPPYIRTTAMFFCIVIMLLGVVGNVMVPIVIVKTKDMRNSTNIFLTNLSIADLLVLLVCTPTVLVEVNTRPETWVLGHEMCKAVPFVELTVAHASVLTILAISFERYYAICEPLKAGYVCTKGRAILICVLAWGIAALFTSPILWVAEYKLAEYIDGSSVAVCLTQAITDWTIAFFLMTISVFFVVPFVTLVVLYGIIARNLVSNRGAMLRARPTKPELSLKARKQVVLMLGAVVLSFFVCLLPFRVLTLWIILSTDQTLHDLGLVRYYSLLYFCRIMVYLNSAMNPILYNLMSTKFRRGFGRLCQDAGRVLLEMITLGRRNKGASRGRSGTLTLGMGTNTNTNTNSSNATAATSSSILSRSSNRRCSEDISRTRLKIELQMPCGSDLEAMAMLKHSELGKRMARRESDSRLMSLRNPQPRRQKPQISFDEEALGGSRTRAAKEKLPAGNPTKMDLP